MIFLLSTIVDGTILIAPMISYTDLTRTACPGGSAVHSRLSQRFASFMRGAGVRSSIGRTKLSAGNLDSAAPLDYAYRPNRSVAQYARLFPRSVLDDADRERRRDRAGAHRLVVPQAGAPRSDSPSGGDLYHHRHVNYVAGGLHRREERSPAWCDGHERFRGDRHLF